MQVVTVGNLGDVFDVGVSAPGEIGVRDVVGATSLDAGEAGLVPAPAAGDEGKFLRGDGAWADAPLGVYGSVVKASTTAVTEALGNWQDMLVSIELPGAGVYLVGGDIHGVAGGSFAQMKVRLFDVTAGSPIANSERVGVSGGSGARSSASINVFVTVDEPTEIRLEAARLNGSPSVYSDGDGRTVLRYIKLA